MFCLTRRCFSFVGRPVCFVLSHETLFFLCGLTTSHRFTATHATLDASLTQVLLNKGLIWPYSPYKTLQSQVAVTCCTLGLYVRHLDCFWSLLSLFGSCSLMRQRMIQTRSGLSEESGIGLAYQSDQSKVSETNSTSESRAAKASRRSIICETSRARPI